MRLFSAGNPAAPSVQVDLMMFFNHPAVRAHLLRHGAVYTLRQKRRAREGRESLVTGRLYETKPLGAGLVTFVKAFEPLRLTALKPYVAESGFEKPEDWAAAYLQMHKRKKPRPAYLYRVELLRDAEEES